MCGNNRKKLLVVLEQHFVRDGADVYTDVQCDEQFWDRYLAVFDSLIVCARMRDARPSDDCSCMLHSSRRGVEFVSLPDFVGVSGLVKNHQEIIRAMRFGLGKADAAICRLPSPLSLVACPAFEKSGIPWAGEMMMNPRTAYSKDAMSHPLQPVIQAVITRSTKRACMRANGIAYVTERVLQREYPCQAIVNPSRAGYFTSSYSTINLPDEAFSMKDWGVQRPERVVLAHSGKMSDYRKGHATFIRTVAELRKTGIDARGVLIGDGPKRVEFETLATDLGIRDYCEFTGWANGFIEVQERLQRAQFFVFPTLSEGLPRAVIEAMASGLICLGNSVDGIPELLDEPCLSTTNEAADFAKRIIRLVSEWTRALEIRARQFEKAHEYSAAILNKRRTQFYQRLFDVDLPDSN